MVDLEVKASHTVISGVDNNRESTSIIRAVADLGTSLGIETMAEGVETVEQLDAVRRLEPILRKMLDDHMVQFDARPQSAAELPGAIRRFSRDVAAA